MGTICFTGHRRLPLPESRYHIKLGQVIGRAIDAGHRSFISGGAVGIDQIAAQQVLKLGAELTIAKPFPSQDKIWPDGIKKRFAQICSCTSNVIDVSPDPFTARKMQVRNEWMVNHSDIVIAVFNSTPGGTMNCINYAKSQGKKILLIDACDLSESWSNKRIGGQHVRRNKKYRQS